MDERTSLLLRVSLAAVALLLAGCATTPSARFYSLMPMSPQQAEKSAQETRLISVNVTPVELPDALNRQQIVTREGQNELQLAEFDRWAGSLGENITVVLAENLALRLGSEQVFAYPRTQAVSPDYTVAVRVVQLDCVPGDQVQLKAQWTLLTGAERTAIATRRTVYTEKLHDRQYSALVAAVSRTLAQLSSDITGEIRAGTAGRQ